MRRFFALTLFGGLAALAGHAAISLGLHPQSRLPALTVLEGCAALAVGTALFATGMIGLAEGYERVAARVTELLARKELPGSEVELAVRNEGGLCAANTAFWRGYAVAAGGIALFMVGLIGLTAGLTRAAPSLHAIGTTAGIICLGLCAAALCGRGLRRVRRAHVTVDASARLLERQPDRRPIEPVAARGHRIPRYALFPRRGSSGTSRGLDRRSRPTTTAPAGST